MRKYLLLSLLLIINLQVNAQSPSFEWAKNMGGYHGYAAGTSVVADASGNVYTTGYFDGRVDFDPGANVSFLVSAGSYDIFVTKADAAGNFLWAKQMGGAGDDRGKSIVVNSSGNVVLTGFFYGTGDFDPGAATFNLIATGGQDIFIVMLNASGNFSWARQIGSTGVDAGNAIAIDASDNIYTTGSFDGGVDFDPGPGYFYLSTSGNRSVFISKLNSNGNFVWAKHMHGG